MKSNLYKAAMRLVTGGLFTACMLMLNSPGFAQSDSTAPSVTQARPKVKPVKNTFNSVWIIDNQTVMVPVKGTFEMDIQHRFGVLTKGYKDFWGLFAPSNIRLGVSYSPYKNLYLGIGITKEKLLWDASAKYAFFTQTPGKYPVSVTYYGNLAYDTREDADGSIFKYQTERMSFFNQLIIARKISDKLSIQIAPSISHQNSVPGYYTKNDSTGKETFKNMEFNHFAIAVSARYKITNGTAIMFNYDQPITKHNTNNPNPNFSVGFEFGTSGHSFQLFMTNFYNLNPQQNNLYNNNNPFKYTNSVTGKEVPGGQFLIGFNITRLWN
ncbi:MAG: hypothetical protein RLZZ28_589 [Bacteroidota bacterium]|jgi:hypothetical protein